MEETAFHASQACGGSERAAELLLRSRYANAERSRSRWRGFPAQNANLFRWVAVFLSSFRVAYVRSPHRDTRDPPITVWPLSLRGLREYRNTVWLRTLVLPSPKNEPSWGQSSSPYQRPTALGMCLPHEGRTSRLCFYQAKVPLPCGKKIRLSWYLLCFSEGVDYIFC